MRAGLERRRVGRASIASVAVLAVPGAVAVALCLYELNGRNLWLDEAASVTIASQHGGAFGAALAHDGGNMLGYYALLHVLISLFGSGPAAIRLASVVGAGAGVTLTALLALRLFGRRCALLAGLLAAVSLTLVYWGQNARAYTLMIALICASFLAFVRLLEGVGWRPWIAYGISTTAAIYCGLAAVLIVPAQLVILAWHRPRAWPVLSSMAAAGLCSAPLAVLALERGSGQLFWVPRPSFKSLKHVVESLSSSGLEPSFYTGSGRFLVYLTLGLVLLGAVRAAYLARSGSWRPALVLSWLLVPVGFSVVISELGQSIFEPRYLLVCLPAVSLLLAWLLAGIWESGSLRAQKLIARRRPGMRRVALVRGLAVGLLAALLALRALQLVPSYGKSSEPWRSATRYVLSAAHPGDCLAFYPLDARMPFRYYVPKGAAVPRAVLPNLSWNRAQPYVEQYVVPPASKLASAVSHCSRVWLVSSHRGDADGPSRSRANYQRYFVLLALLGTRYPSLRAASFGYAGIISVTLFSA